MIAFYLELILEVSMVKKIQEESSKLDPGSWANIIFKLTRQMAQYTLDKYADVIQFLFSCAPTSTDYTAKVVLH